MRWVLSFFLIFSFFITGPSKAGEGEIVVVELFTAQGCGYSEKIEAMFDGLAKMNHANLVLMSCHVTVFDTEQYKDPFSNPWCDDRNKRYNRITGQFDTPDLPRVVVNGKFVETASNEVLVKSAIEMGHSLNNVMPIQASLREGFIDLTFPKMRLDEDQVVWLIGYKKRFIERPPKALFDGPTERLFVHPITHSRKLLAWDGRYANISIPLQEMVDAEGFAVLAQNARTRSIIAAGKIER